MKKIIAILIAVTILCGCSATNQPINSQESPKENNNEVVVNSGKLISCELSPIYSKTDATAEPVGYVGADDYFEYYDVLNVDGKIFVKISENAELYIVKDENVKEFDGEFANLKYSYELNNLKEIKHPDENGNTENTNSMVFNYNGDTLKSYTYCGNEEYYYSEDPFIFLYGENVVNQYDSENKIIKQTLTYSDGTSKEYECEYDAEGNVSKYRNKEYEYVDGNIVNVYVNGELFNLYENNGNLSFCFNVFNGELTYSSVSRYNSDGWIVEKMYNPEDNLFSRNIYLY